MIKIISKNKKLFALLIASLMLCSCGGGGGSSPIQSGSSTPAPAPTPDPIIFDTPEFRENFALAQINVQAAYENGITGNGVLVAVIDSGVTEVPELLGQLHAASTNVATGDPADADDFGGHGTAMAGIIAALQDNATNNSAFNMHGVAFNAQILAINATTAADCPDFNNCSFFHSDIALGYDYAVANGADVINESLGSDNFSSIGLQQAVKRAVEADIVIVVPAGNIDVGVDPPGTGDAAQLSTAVAYATWANGQIIIAGSVDDNNVISDFSYRAGSDAQNVFLVAPGEDIITPNFDVAESNYIQISGTSASTAIISGAAALLIEAFQNLSAAQIADLLFTTATDLGAPGTDIIYGRGLVNLDEAFTAQGLLVVAGQGFGSATVVGENGTLSAQSLIISGGAFGADISFSNSFSNVMVLDKYQRSFNVDLSTSIVLPQGAISLIGFADGVTSSRNQTLRLNDRTTLKMGWRGSNRFSENNKLYFSNHFGREKDVGNLRMSLSYNLSDQNTAKFSTGMSIAEMLDDYRPDDYMAPNRQGFSSLLSPQDNIAMAYKTTLNPKTDFEVAFARNDTSLDPLIFSQTIKVKSSFLLNRLKHRINDKMNLTVDLGLMREKGSVLGAISRGALEIGSGAKSAFMGFKFDMMLSGKIRFFAQSSYGITSVDQSSTGIIGNISSLKSHSYLAGLISKAVLFDNDQLSISFSQPLRLNSGNALVSNVSSRDYSANIFNLNFNAISLTPSGRERDIELSYGIGNIYGHSLRLNLLHQINPGHVRNVKNVTSALLRIGSAF